MTKSKNSQEEYLKNLWVPVSGAIAQQRKVETIANNVANANTAGFKKDDLTFKEHVTALENGHQDIDLPQKEWKPEDFYRSYGAENAQVKVDGSFTDFSQGDLTPTGNPLDIGIKGEGFLEVLSPNGVRYTRKGILSVNNQGVLVTDQGLPVLSKLNINPLENEGISQPQDRVIRLPRGKVSVNLQGEIFVGNERVEQLSVQEFNDIQALKKEGNSQFINPDPKNLKTDEVASTLHQGFVEGSNVNALSEMSELIKANRHFESIQKAIKAYDNMSGKSVNEISRF